MSIPTYYIVANEHTLIFVQEVRGSSGTFRLVVSVVLYTQILNLSMVEVLIVLCTQE